MHLSLEAVWTAIAAIVLAIVLLRVFLCALFPERVR